MASRRQRRPGAGDIVQIGVFAFGVGRGGSCPAAAFPVQCERVFVSAFDGIAHRDARRSFVNAGDGVQDAVFSPFWRGVDFPDEVAKEVFLVPHHQGTFFAGNSVAANYHACPFEEGAPAGSAVEDRARAFDRRQGDRRPAFGGFFPAFEAGFAFFAADAEAYGDEFAGHIVQGGTRRGRNYGPRRSVPNLSQSPRPAAVRVAADCHAPAFARAIDIRERLRAAFRFAWVGTGFHAPRRSGRERLVGTVGRTFGVGGDDPVVVGRVGRQARDARTDIDVLVPHPSASRRRRGFAAVGRGQAVFELVGRLAFLRMDSASQGGDGAGNARSRVGRRRGGRFAFFLPNGSEHRFVAEVEQRLFDAIPGGVFPAGVPLFDDFRANRFDVRLGRRIRHAGPDRGGPVYVRRRHRRSIPTHFRISAARYRRSDADPGSGDLHPGSPVAEPGEFVVAFGRSKDFVEFGAAVARSGFRARETVEVGQGRDRDHVGMIGGRMGAHVGG